MMFEEISVNEPRRLLEISATQCAIQVMTNMTDVALLDAPAGCVLLKCPSKLSIKSGVRNGDEATIIPNVTSFPAVLDL